MKALAFFALFASLAAAPALAQKPPPGVGPDATEELQPGLWSVHWGTMGLNVGVSSGADGVLLVDAQQLGGVPRLKEEIAKRTDKPVRIIINTHWHFDHVGANAEFRKLGALTIANNHTRTRLMSDQINPLGGMQKAFPEAFWPMLTFTDEITLHFNGDDIDLIHVPNAHTDGDVIVRFRKADVLFAADLFNNGDYTRVDMRGGSLDGMIAAYRKLLPTLDDKVKVVPGRGNAGTKKDLEDYLKVMVALRQRIGKMVADGKTMEEAVAAKPTAEFDAKWANGPIKPDSIVEEFYSDLKRREK
jgi:cyclase